MTIEEYNQTVDELADRIYRFVLSRISDEDKAKDVVQDSYERMWRHRKNVEAKKARSYLFTTAHHALIDSIRKEKREVVFKETPAAHPKVENGFSDLQEVLHGALKTLPEIQQTVVLLRDYEGYSYQEIGKITGLNESQVKVYIYRARLALKKIIGNMDVLV